ncbi:hypothetical protein K456DRAFT_1044864 [Colletotrichum gloeosporioides 23]|nr:hypothetical protein K456DRAFT_1044864 [Colletotrichum gloeosporioides 23]
MNSTSEVRTLGVSLGVYERSMWCCRAGTVPGTMRDTACGSCCGSGLHARGLQKGAFHCCDSGDDEYISRAVLMVERPYRSSVGDGSLAGRERHTRRTIGCVRWGKSILELRWPLAAELDIWLAGARQRRRKGFTSLCPQSAVVCKTTLLFIRTPCSTVQSRPRKDEANTRPLALVQGRVWTKSAERCCFRAKVKAVSPA